MIKVEIIAVGNEILLGDVLDSNTNWICKKITGIGGFVNRAVVVRDKLDDIASEIEDAFRRKIDLIVTTGGMGPTSDDMTLEAIAKATSRPLQLDNNALDIVQKRYAYFASQGFVDDEEITPSRMKMAQIPHGGKALYNPVGAAPGVIVEHNSSRIIALPGVPAELKGIFNDTLQPFLKDMFGESVFLETLVIVNCKDESVLAPILKDISGENAKVYIKSRPKRFGVDVKMRVTLSIAAESNDEAEERLEKALGDLKRILHDKGITIESISER